MPLLDHFHPPLNRQHSWESFFSNWVTRLADAINALLQPHFFAEEQAQYPEGYRVHVFRSSPYRPPLVGEITLITPANKEHLPDRQASTLVSTHSLRAGVGLVLVDIVTNHAGNLHNELVTRLTPDSKALFPDGTRLYAVAYQPRLDGRQGNLACWLDELKIGGQLPTLPLFLADDVCVPVDLEATYSEACRRRRII